MTDPGWLRSVPFAHRGLHDPAAGLPENSLAAFEAAVAEGYGIELDVRGSVDGVPMVFHDQRLDRLTQSWGAVTVRTAADLGRMMIAGTDQMIPALPEVLALVAGRVPLLVEIKAGGHRLGVVERAVVKLLVQAGGRYAVQSFSPAVVNWLRRHAPSVTRGQIAMDFAAHGTTDLRAHEKWIAGRMLLNGLSKPHFIAYDVRALPNRATAKARAKGVPLLTWTVRSAAEREQAQAYADNIIFEGFRP